MTEGISDLPGIQFRKKNDPDGGLGNWVYIRTSGKAQRDELIKAIHAENLPAEPMEGSAILPIATHIEKKETLQPGWPSFTVRGKTIQYGAAACPRTIEVYNRYAGIPIDPEDSGPGRERYYRRGEKSLPGGYEIIGAGRSAT